MDEIATLSHEIEFHEKFRGYDPDEVDAYVDRVRKVAALATGRLEELHHRAEAAEALIAAGRVDSAEETLGRTLLLAQQTADQLVIGAREESARITGDADQRVAALLTDAQTQSADTIKHARAEAASISDEAAERASRLLAEAETDRREMIRKAQTEATTAADEARSRLSADLSSLSATRDFLSDDIDMLERHVREQRANLALVVSSLIDLVEQPGAFRLDPAPATSGVVATAAESTSESDLDSSQVESVQTEPERDSMAASLDLEDALADIDAPEGSVDPSVVEGSVVEGSVVEGSVVEGSVDSSTTDPGSERSSSPESELAEDPVGIRDQSQIVAEQPSHRSEVINLDEIESVEAQDESSAEVASVPDPTPPRLVTAADAESSMQEPDPIDPGPATAPIPVLRSEPLFAEVSSGHGTELFTPRVGGLSDGDLLSDDSEALSAFFDQDNDETDRSWFGRRR